jgi:hypothetical protein
MLKGCLAALGTGLTATGIAGIKLQDSVLKLLQALSAHMAYVSAGRDVMFD